MAIHYFASQDTVACGRTGSTLSSTQNASEVSCKLCLRSLEKETAEPVRKTPTLAELRAAAKAAKAAAEGVVDGAAAAAAKVEAAPVQRPEIHAPSVPAAPAPAVKTPAAAGAVEKPSATPNPRAEWQQRLAQLPGKNRLPRGVARQAFI